MKLADLSIGAIPNSVHERIGFNWETHCVRDIYLRNLLPYKNKHIEKLNIILVGPGEQVTTSLLSTGMQIGRFSNLLSIGEILLDFDFESYFKKSDFEKKLSVLKKVLEGFNAFATQTDSDPKPFADSYEKCLEQNIEDQYLYKEVACRSKTHTVKVFIKVDLQKLEVFGVFQDGTGEIISRKVFFKTKPAALYDEYLGDVVWSAENEVTLYGRRRDEFWKIEL